MSITTTDINFGAISVTGAVKTTGTTPNAGQLAIDTDRSKIVRLADKAIITLFLTFNDDDEITILFGSSIIPSGAKILAPLDSNAQGLNVTSVADNSITLNRDDAVDGNTQIGVTLIVDGYDDISIRRSSNAPFEGDNVRMESTFFASDVVLDADFTGLQVNTDRTIATFHFSSILLTATQFTCNLIRTLNGSTTHQTVTKAIGDLTITDGEFTATWTGSDVSSLGLTEVTMRISEDYAKIAGSGYTESQTKFNSQHIFKDEISLKLRKDIVATPTEIMGGLDDVNGFNFKEMFKFFDLTSAFNELPDDNYVRLNYFTLSRTANTIYMSFRIYTKDDVLIREISGGGNMTVSVTDWSHIEQDYTLDGYRVRWIGDFSTITSNTTISGLTKDNAMFKIPARNLERTNNYFDDNSNTLGNTVNKRNFDISRFVENIRIVPTSSSFVVENGSIKSARVRYFNVSATEYYMAFQIGTSQYTGVTVARNANTGSFDVEFVYPDFTAIVTAQWNEITSYLFNYDALPNDAATLKRQVMLDAFTETFIKESSTAFNTKYIYAASADRIMPYLWKSIDWGQATKEPKTCFLSLTDCNDEEGGLTNVLEFRESDAALQAAIKFAIFQGDAVTTYAITSAQDFIDRIATTFDAITTDLPILHCKGNHCLGLDGLTNFSLAPSHATIKTELVDKFYDRLPQNYKDATTRGTGDAAYYYTDVPDTNLRVISLDQFEYPIVDGTAQGRAIKYSGAAIFNGNPSPVAGFNVYYTEAQLNFLINALNTMPTTHTALILTHIPINSTTDNNGDLNALGNSNIALRAILESFKDATSVAVNVDAIDEIGAFTVNTVFSGRSNSKIAIFEGHIHDSNHYKIGNINVIRNQAIGNTAPYASLDGDTVSKYGADIMCLNEDTNELMIVRYGTRRTIKGTLRPIGTDYSGFSFVTNPLKL